MAMYTGTNPSALRSRDLIVSVTLELAQEMPLNCITVKLVMQQSGLSRQTFYQIFNSLEEVLEYHFDQLFQSYFTKGACKDNLCDVARLFFTFFETHKDFIRLLMQSNMQYLLQRRCKAYMADEQYICCCSREGITTPAEKEYAVTFMITGIIGMLGHWLSSNATTTADDLAHLVCRVTNTES